MAVSFALRTLYTMAQAASREAQETMTYGRAGPRSRAKTKTELARDDERLTTLRDAIFTLDRRAWTYGEVDLYIANGPDD